MVADVSSSRIYLAGGKVALVSPEDAVLVISYSWYCHCGYARGWVDGANTYMHRLILGALPGQVCDHINGNRLDNRRENLRFVTSHQNARNKAPKNEYIGVYRAGKKWGASLVREDATYWLGSYDSKELAGYAVDTARILMDGELARPNVPNFIPTAEEKAAVEKAVRSSISPRTALGKATISKIRESKLSDKYWANRLGVRPSVIKSVRE